MDVLSDLLHAVRLNGALFFDVRASDPMVATTPSMSLIGPIVMPEADHVIPFHIMLRGSCWSESIGTGEEPVRLSQGDIVIYPHGHAHVFATEPGKWIEPDIDSFRLGAGQSLPFLQDLSRSQAASMRFVCGYLGCDASPFNPLLDALPPQLLARRPPEGNHIEVDLIESAVEETGNQREGSETILARLSELLFVRVLRRHISLMSDTSTGWLAGLRDPNVAIALRLIHGDPAHDWTLEALARSSGMSRSALAERFAFLVGESPIRYLNRWRMQLAARRLRESGEPVANIAEDVGYHSESAFIRSFKKTVGQSPGAWRRHTVAEP